MSLKDTLFSRNTSNIKDYSTNFANLSPLELYNILDNYYDSNDLYRDLNKAANTNQVYREPMQSLRTPVHRSVSFFESNVAVGEMTITIENDSTKILSAIKKFHKWSNFKQQKQVHLRHLPLYGDLFTKVQPSVDKIYMEEIRPKYVTKLSEDSRGNLTSIQIDIPIDGDNKSHTLYHTELWEKKSGPDGYVATWTHSQGMEVDTTTLGTPDTFMFLYEMGISFIPIIHTKFENIGKNRGRGCAYHALQKIDEANRKATKLASDLFRYNKATMILTTPEGAEIDWRDVTDTMKENPQLVQNGILVLPEGVAPGSFDRGVNYADALAVVNADIAELYQDMPELLYYDTKDRANQSGEAIRNLIAGAIDRKNEMEDNYVAGLIRANEMALTLGAFYNLPGFTGIGTYDENSFAHSIQFSSAFDTSDKEKADIFISLAADLGVELALEIAGYDTNVVDKYRKSASTIQANRQTNLANALTNFNRQ